MKQRGLVALDVGDSVPPLAQRASATAPPPHDALADSQRQLAAALQKIDRLVAQKSLLEEQLARAESALAQARADAYHDPLTGLPNRVLLLDRLKQATALGARQNKLVALLFLDLDGFKRINDALGHASGDRLLQQVAARLTACIRASDTACRYGGDEFVVLLPELDGKRGAVSTAEKIRDHLATPYRVDDTVISMTTSIGMALYPADGEDCGELIRASDREMYRDKRRARAAPSIAGEVLRT